MVEIMQNLPVYVPFHWNLHGERWKDGRRLGKHIPLFV